MKYVMCPHCGRHLCKGIAGTKVEIECPKCRRNITVVIDTDELYISKKPLIFYISVAKEI